MNRTLRALFIFTAAISAWACAANPADTPAHSPPPDPAATADEPSEPDEEAPPPSEATCGGKTCTPPAECIRYYGVAGPSLPLFTCGLPCTPQGECPTGLTCTTIADGPRLCQQ